MELNATELMEPVLHYLDGIIRDYGLYIYMGMVYAAPFLIAWILSGGVWRKRFRRYDGVTTPINRTRTTAKPPPLPPTTGDVRGREQRAGDDDDSSSFAA